MKYHVLTGAALGVLLTVTTFAFAAEFEGIQQRAINEGDVTNSGTINTGRITRDGISVSVSATGAVAQISVSNLDVVGSRNGVTGSEFNEVTQKAYNSGAISNTGQITTEKLKGAGPSVSVSALGAGSVISLSTVNNRR